MGKLTLSIIMPALNEEKNIKDSILSSLNAMKKFNVEGEIIVVNDGSSDNTPTIVENLSKTNLPIRMISHQRPMGIGYSFWDGVKNSAKDVVVMFPGDNEHDPDSALEFFYLMNNVDIIVPFIHNVEVRNKFRRIISSLYRFIINMSFGINLNYTNGTVFYRREILGNVELNSKGFFYQAELLVSLIRKGYLFAEVPHFLGVRGSGKSKAVTFKSLLKVMKEYLKLSYDVHVLRREGQVSKVLVKNSVTYQKMESHKEI